MEIRCRSQLRSGSFSLHGKYRVQSAQRMMDSTLAGVWLEPKAHGCLDSKDVTRLARAHRACLDPRAEITLAPAFISERSGAFASNEDALYYADHFEATEGTDALPGDVLDVSKLQHLWRERRVVLEPLVRTDLHIKTLLAGDITPIAIDEYMCHEAGHLLGVSVQQKQRQGYFRLGGRFRWPLVYIEEFRADINAWELALTHLDATRARKVITYTLLHRLGLAARNLSQGLPGAGFVPFLDFSVAWRAGLIQIESHAMSPIRFDTSAHSLRRLYDDILCVSGRLTLSDQHRPNLWDMAQRSMSWLDESLRNDEAVLAFRAALLPAERVTRDGVVPESRSLYQ